MKLSLAYWALAVSLGAANRPAPAWKNDSWLNTSIPITLESLKGRVTLLNFWVFTCYNCTNTVPSLVDFDHKFREKGLTLIGIHTPEFPPYGGEHDKGDVQRALQKYHIEYPMEFTRFRGQSATWEVKPATPPRVAAVSIGRTAAPWCQRMVPTPTLHPPPPARVKRRKTSNSAGTSGDGRG